MNDYSTIFCPFSTYIYPYFESVKRNVVQSCTIRIHHIEFQIPNCEFVLPRLITVMITIMMRECWRTRKYPGHVRDLGDEIPAGNLKEKKGGVNLRTLGSQTDISDCAITLIIVIIHSSCECCKQLRGAR